MTRRTWTVAAGGAALLGCRGGPPAGRTAAAAPAAAVAAAPGPVEAAAPVRVEAAASAATTRMLARAIPRTGERLPAIGMGTWETFDVGRDEASRGPLREVLRVFAGGGGTVIDSSPMYGAAEEVTGDLVAETGAPNPAFLATKVWTTGRDAGLRQMSASLRLLRADRLDLLQVHNLQDFAVHVESLRRWKAEGKVRYIGATHYRTAAFADLERVIREEGLDFVQLPYSLALRDAEDRLLPAAADHGVAVLVNRPFEGGELFAAVRGRALPPWSADLECTSWAQLFLKFILAHPAVHCPLPATRRAEHMADNVRAGVGPLPDAEQRRKMIDLLG